MKRLALFAGFTILCLYLSAWAAEEAVSFSGTWIPDPKKSDAAPRFIMPVGNSPVGDVSMGRGGMGMPGGGMGMPGGGMGMPGGGMGGPGSMGGPEAQKPQPPPALLPMTIEQTDSEIRITTKMQGMGGQEMPIVESYKLDGQDLVEMVQAPFSKEKVKKTTSAKLKKNKFQTRVETNNAPPMQGSSAVKKEYALSKDTKVLTLEVTTSGMFQSVQKLVYNKQ
jgi:hypothetical protein